MRFRRRNTSSQRIWRDRSLSTSCVHVLKVLTCDHPCCIISCSTKSDLIINIKCLFFTDHNWLWLNLSSDWIYRRWSRHANWHLWRQNPWQLLHHLNCFCKVILHFIVQLVDLFAAHPTSLNSYSTHLSIFNPVKLPEQMHFFPLINFYPKLFSYYNNPYFLFVFLVTWQQWWLYSQYYFCKAYSSQNIQ